MRNSENKGAFFGRLLYEILYFAIINVLFWFFWLIVSLFFANVINELAGRAEAQNFTEIKNSVIYLLYLVTLVTVCYLNPVERGAYLSDAYENKLTFLGELLRFCKIRLWSILSGCALFTMPFYVIYGIYPEMPLISSFYLAQHSLFELCGNLWLSYAVYVLSVALVLIVAIPVIQKLWYSQRLRK